MSFNSDQSSTPARPVPSAHLQRSGIEGREVRKSSRKRKPSTYLTYDQDFRHAETLAKSARTSRSRGRPQRAPRVQQNTEDRLKTRNGTQKSQGVRAANSKVVEWTEGTPRRGRLRASKLRASEDETPIAEPSTSQMMKERAMQQGNSIAVTLETKFAQLENEEREDTETQFNAPSTIERDSSWTVVNRQRNNRKGKRKRK
jgi:hypothetical protein